MPVVAAVLLAGCATGYQDASNPLVSWTGGYQEAKGPGELTKVSFLGNGIITQEKAGTYLLYRCAEIAKRENKPYFALYQNLHSAVVDKRSPGKTVNSIGGKPTGHAYILLFDSPAPGLLSTSEVLARLEPEVKEGRAK